MGRACHDVEGRLLAAAGMMNEASPGFDGAALAVAGGGVLAALPMLLKRACSMPRTVCCVCPKGSTAFPPSFSWSPS